MHDMRRRSPPAVSLQSLDQFLRMRNLNKRYASHKLTDIPNIIKRTAVCRLCNAKLRPMGNLWGCPYGHGNLLTAAAIAVLAGIPQPNSEQLDAVRAFARKVARKGNR
jgi:hypothetical protein